MTTKTDELLPGPSEGPTLAVVPTTRRGLQRRGQVMWIWLFLLPTVVLYGLYTIYPIVASYWYSFVRWNGFSADKEFVGVANYREVFADPQFWNSFKITLLFMLLVHPRGSSSASFWRSS